MWIILSFLIFGGLTGYFLRSLQNLNQYSEKITSYLIYILLFFMGLSIGVNPEVMSNLDRIGFNSLMICVFTVTGSILMAFLFTKLTSRR